MADPNLKSHISYLKSKNYVIIVAGGSGARMQSAIPKQFLLLKGKPVIMHTVATFENSAAKPQIIVVLPADYMEHWEQLCSTHRFTIEHTVVNGGNTRFHSVKNALDIIPDDNDILVAVHDAVRPLAAERTIIESYMTAAAMGNAITAVKSRDSVRQLKNNASICLPRNEIYLVQTPQTFQLHQLKKAYRQVYNEQFTDDASVVEAVGFQINLIEGDHNNIKITFPEDLTISELLLSS